MNTFWQSVIIATALTFDAGTLWLMWVTWTPERFERHQARVRRLTDWLSR
jgi:hypothetical protein